MYDMYVEIQAAMEETDKQRNLGVDARLVAHKFDSQQDAEIVIIMSRDAMDKMRRLYDNTFNAST